MRSIAPVLVALLLTTVTVAGNRITVDATKVTGGATSYTTTAWDHFTIE